MLNSITGFENLSNVIIDISKPTAIKYMQSFNEKCVRDLDKDNMKLGDRKVVEIDESKFARFKHCRGKDLEIKLVWVFGMKERGARRCYFKVSDCSLFHE